MSIAIENAYRGPKRNFSPFWCSRKLRNMSPFEYFCEIKLPISARTRSNFFPESLKNSNSTQTRFSKLERARTHPYFRKVLVLLYFLSKTQLLGLKTHERIQKSSRPEWRKWSNSDSKPLYVWWVRAAKVKIKTSANKKMNKTEIHPFNTLAGEQGYVLLSVKDNF